MIRLQPRSPARLGSTAVAVAVAVAIAIAAIPQVAVAVIAFPVLSLLTGPTQFGRRPRSRPCTHRRFLFVVVFDFTKKI